MDEVDYFEMMCLCLCQAWEPLHSSEGFALTGARRHSWATQSWSLAAAGRLSQQPWPTWTLPHPNYQGNSRGGTACCNNLLLLYDTGLCRLTQANMAVCTLNRLVHVWFTHASSGTTYAVVWACIYSIQYATEVRSCVIAASLLCKIAEKKTTLISLLLLTQMHC